MTSRGQAPTMNRILDSLTSAESADLLPHLERVPLDLDTVLSKEGAAMTHVYFPVSGMISLVTRVGDFGIESGTIGIEGMLGLPVFFHAENANADCIVQVQGEAMRATAASFLEAVERSPGLNGSLMQYAAANLWVTYRSAACSRVHSLAQRTARWLLLVHDHASVDSFDLTHRYLAQMLGVRRAGVTNALGALQRKGIIASRRGRITILDRPMLETEACECDAIIRSRRMPI